MEERLAHGRCWRFGGYLLVGGSVEMTLTLQYTDIYLLTLVEKCARISSSLTVAEKQAS